MESQFRWCKGILAAALLAVLILAAGCGGPGGEVEVGGQDNGGQVALKQGQVLVVSLESNPTTGYSWEVAEIDDAVLKQKGEVEYQQADAGDPPKVGVGGVETFRFEAQGAGTASLKLVYHRPWEEGVEPLETYTLEVTVR